MLLVFVVTTTSLYFTSEGDSEENQDMAVTKLIVVDKLVNRLQNAKENKVRALVVKARTRTTLS